jgi:hypothetical protein
VCPKGGVVFLPSGRENIKTIQTPKSGSVALSQERKFSMNIRMADKNDLELLIKLRFDYFASEGQTFTPRKKRL